MAAACRIGPCVSSQSFPENRRNPVSRPMQTAAGKPQNPLDPARRNALVTAHPSGRCVMVRPLPSKQEIRVRFPSPAPVLPNLFQSLSTLGPTFPTWSLPAEYQARAFVVRATPSVFVRAQLEHLLWQPSIPSNGSHHQTVGSNTWSVGHVLLSGTRLGCRWSPYSRSPRPIVTAGAVAIVLWPKANEGSPRNGGHRNIPVVLSGDGAAKSTAEATSRRRCAV